MEIGTQFVLWKEEYSNAAYKDQLGKDHDGYIVLEEFVVTVTEVKTVPGTWSREPYEGWKAVTEDGKEFTCNFTSFPDDSMTPTYFWDTVVDEDVWQPVNAEQAFEFYIHVDKEGNRKIPIGHSVCAKHNIAFTKTCWRCDWDQHKLDRKASSND